MALAALIVAVVAVAVSLAGFVWSIAWSIWQHRQVTQAEVKGTRTTLALARWELQTPTPLPLKLGPGETWNGHFDLSELKRGAAEVTRHAPPWKVTVVVRDAADRAYRAPTVDVGGP